MFVTHSFTGASFRFLHCEQATPLSMHLTSRGWGPDPSGRGASAGERRRLHLQTDNRLCFFFVLLSCCLLNIGGGSSPLFALKKATRGPMPMGCGKDATKVTAGQIPTTASGAERRQLTRSTDLVFVVILAFVRQSNVACATHRL